jgi:hypothetical protein
MFDLLSRATESNAKYEKASEIEPACTPAVTSALRVPRTPAADLHVREESEIHMLSSHPEYPILAAFVKLLPPCPLPLIPLRPYPSDVAFCILSMEIESYDMKPFPDPTASSTDKEIRRV